LLQQQNFSLAALAKRDQGDDPFGKASAPAPSPAPPSDDDESVKTLAELIKRGFSEAA
jgi:hypothetical protein